MDEYQAFIVKLVPRGKIVPRDAPRLQRLVAELLPRSVIRVANGYIELVTFNKPGYEQLRRLEEALDARVLGVEAHEEEYIDNEDLLKKYLDLLAVNKFWEAHVVAERIWRERGVVGKYLAALAGAFAKAQEGLLEPAKKILEKAVSSKELYGVVDPDCLFEELLEVYRRGGGRVTRCIDAGKLAELLGGKSRAR